MIDLQYLTALDVIFGINLRDNQQLVLSVVRSVLEWSRNEDGDSDSLLHSR